MFTTSNQNLMETTTNKLRTRFFEANRPKIKTDNFQTYSIMRRLVQEKFKFSNVLVPEEAEGHVSRLSLGYPPLPVLATEDVDGNLTIHSKELQALVMFLNEECELNGLKRLDVDPIDIAELEDMQFKFTIVYPSNTATIDLETFMGQ